jgi:high affinity Mn2+ porin
MLKATCLLFFFLFSASLCRAQDGVTEEKWNLHFQGTYISQYKPAFSEKYHGQNSLKDSTERVNSVTATMFFGFRLWKNAEFYFNPEVAGGDGLSGAYGMAASTNGETFRIGDPSPFLYLARGYLKQTFPLGDNSTTTIDDAANQLKSKEPKQYLRFIIGKISLGDIFDNNPYSNSPRTQFINWCLMNNGAWDYAANLRGYTVAIASILQLQKTSYRFAIAQLPIVANGLDLNNDLSKEYSLNAEVNRNYTWHNKEGHVRLLAYYNNGNMGTYSTATDSNVNIAATRAYGNYRIGMGISADQQLSKYLGAFMRLGYSDGKTETWCFTEADRTLSLGLNINGAAWHGLSDVHKNYLASGGLGFQLGDGQLNNYGNEMLTEIYYSWKPVNAALWISGDYQFAINPGYNKDRGPVNVFSMRVHVEL